MALARYRCHTVVEAGQISAIERPPTPSFSGIPCRGSSTFGTACGHCDRCTWEQTRSHVVILRFGPDDAHAVSGGWLARHRPEVGGYFVRDADGDESFSPAAAFEAGYTRLTPVALVPTVDMPRA